MAKTAMLLQPGVYASMCLHSILILALENIFNSIHFVLTITLYLPQNLE